MKTTTLTIAIIAASTILAGCALLQPAPLTPEQNRDAHTTVFRDDFKKITWIETSKIYFSEFGVNSLSISGHPNVYRLLATKKDGEKISYALMFSSDEKMVFWRSMTDQNGNEFPLKKYNMINNKDDSKQWYTAELSREYVENIREAGVLIRKYVEQTQKTGINVKFYGKNRATFPITLSSSIADALLMRVDDVFKDE